MDLGHGYLRQGTPTGRARRVGLLLGGLAVAVLCSAVAAAILVAWPGSGGTPSASRPASRTPAFVKHQLGARRAALPVVSSPRYRAASEVTSGGLRVRLGSASVALTSADGGHGRWTSYAGGAARPNRLRAGVRDRRRLRRRAVAPGRSPPGSTHLALEARHVGGSDAEPPRRRHRRLLPAREARTRACASPRSSCSTATGRRSRPRTCAGRSRARATPGSSSCGSTTGRCRSRT